MASKRVSAKDKIKKDDIFKPTVIENIEINNQVDNEICKQTNKEAKELKRQTYYLEEDMIKALGLKAVLENRDKSEIVRAALKQYIEERYFELGKDI